MNFFSQFSLQDPILNALKAMNFEKPTPIQEQSIPIALKGHDLIGLAQTGTGKTAAFSIPILSRFLSQPGQMALILAPTRELAQQIDGVWKNLSKFSKNTRSVLLVGGVSMHPQTQGLRQNPSLIIATPGRLIDHLNQRNLSLSKVSVLVLDEADRMLDMGFAPQLNQILRHLPQKRQTLLFSATWNSMMDQLSKKYLHNPQRVTVAKTSQAAATISQSVISTTAKDKNDTLLDELNQRQGSILVFARTQHRTDRVAKYLASYGVEVNRIHGGRSQGQRNSALAAFKSGKARVLVATDIAARGIDISHIAHVINYDLPQVAEDYVHRIGRTGRAGNEGSAVSFVTPEERPMWKEIEGLLRKGGSKVPVFQLKANAPKGSQPSLPRH